MKNRKITLIIGLCILFTGCKTKYTFENNSSFPVTVMPEYGDDFQLQSGTVKSFESSHKNMRLSYSPSTYVLVKKISSTQWEFTNGNYYLSEDRGFLVYPPENWQIMPYPGLQYKVIVGPNDNDFASNINFGEEKNPFSQFSTYINVSARNIGEDKKIVSRGRYNTISGLEGFKIETNTETLLQVYYFFDLGQTVFIVTCSAPLQSEMDYYAIFDDCVGTLEFLQ